MKVILYAASTANGLAAKTDGNSDWVSPADTVSFNSVCRSAGCAIMGRHTYEIYNPLSVEEWPNAAGFHIVLTSRPALETSHPDLLVAPSPQIALDLAGQRSLAQVVVIGGSQTFGSFMRDRLVDEIYLDIEPLVFGAGMPLFAAGDFETKLDLLETKPLSPQTIQLHYRVKK